MAISLRKVVSFPLIVWFIITIYGVYFLSDLKNKINFGIDLVGGTYITLEVKVDKLIENELNDRVNHLLKVPFREKQINIIKKSYAQEQLFFTFASEADVQFIQQALSNTANSLTTNRQGTILVFSLPSLERVKLIHDAVEGNITVLRSRIDRFGVGEVVIASQGERHIVIELPNVQNVQKAKSIIGTSALLEVKPVYDTAPSAEALMEKHGNSLPEGTEIVPGKSRYEQERAFYLVPRFTDLTGKLLNTARANPTGGRMGLEPVVEFEFKQEGGEKFYEMTSKSHNPFIAMIVDGVVVTAATAREPLRTRGEISGNFTIEEAQELASLLRSGAFVAPVSFEEDRTIGPSLGSEAVYRGLISCIIGLVLLFIFSIAVYKMAGLFAFIVLLYNLLFILLLLSWLGATLTLPGIAGMVLTIGMAIDSSILIYEKIKEEISHGTSFYTAVNIGFNGAMAIILDANITHFLVALVLYRLGAGAIQGFAVTMIVGIIATLITGLLFLRQIFDYLHHNLKINSVSI